MHAKMIIAAIQDWFHTKHLHVFQPGKLSYNSLSYIRIAWVHIISVLTRIIKHKIKKELSRKEGS